MGFRTLIGKESPGEGLTDEIPEDATEDTADDEKSITSLSTDFEFNPNDDYLHESLDGRLLESKDIAMETAGSALLSLSDRKLTTSYI
eukprot:scaffold2191_cov232-Chaetoceros_neogracile.AAC.4